jgi:hypothetical protein
MLEQPGELRIGARAVGGHAGDRLNAGGEPVLLPARDDRLHASGRTGPGWRHRIAVLVDQPGAPALPGDRQRRGAPGEVRDEPR